MNDEAAFVAAIKAAPNDVNLPLVFADWLDDQGDPRGQWIRNGLTRRWMRPTYENPLPKILAAFGRNYHVRLARRAAVAIGTPIVPGLIDLLKDSSPRVQALACRCLRGIGKRAAAAAPALLELMADRTAAVREEAATALKAVGASGEADATRLQAALADPNQGVRSSARRMLLSMGAKGSVLQDLLERFDSPDPTDRRHALQGFRQLGTAEVVPYLTRALDDPDDGVRTDAVWVLRALGRLQRTAAPAAAALGRTFIHPNAQMRLRAVTAFGRHGIPHTPESVAAVAALLSDPSPDVRAVVCRQLAAKDLASTAVPQLAERLTDAEAKVRAEALKALTGRGKAAEYALTALVGQLDDPDPQHRQLAVRAVGAVGRDNPTAQAALVRLLDDSNPQVAFAAVGELGNWRQLPAELGPTLLARFDQYRAQGSYAAALVRVMGRLSPAPPDVIETLRAIVRNPAAYRAAALEALGAIGPAAAAAVPDVLTVLDDPAVRGRFGYSGAVKTLARLGPSGIEQLAAQLATDGKAISAIEWMCADAELRDAAFPLLPALLDRLGRLAGSARRETLTAIRSFGPRATAAIPALLDGLEAWDEAADRAEVARTLIEFGPLLVPHLPRVGAAASRPGSPHLLRTFTTLLAPFAPQQSAVREPLCALLQLAAQGTPDEKPGDRAARKAARQACAAALFAFNDSALVPTLAALATDPEAEIRSEALSQFGAFDHPTGLPLIRTMLSDPDESVRLLAIDVLTRRADTSDDALAALVHTTEDRAARVRRAAVCALGKLKIGVATEAVRAALATATGDDDKRVAASAAVALKKLTPKARAKAAPKAAAPAAKRKKKPT